MVGFFYVLNICTTMKRHWRRSIHLYNNIEHAKLPTQAGLVRWTLPPWGIEGAALLFLILYP